MGLSHLAILNAHPGVDVAAICDPTRYIVDVLAKYCRFKAYTDFDRMIEAEPLDAVVLAIPSRLHASMVEKALQRGLHVFCEKPFVLDPGEGERLVQLAERSGLVNQVGYHYRFVGAFQEAARIVSAGAIGKVHHVRAEAYGPVVLRPTGATWRSAAAEGGGALYDYACHVLDLVHFIAGAPEHVSGSALGSVFSRGVEDEAYCTLRFPGGASGHLAVNWTDESCRKMTTQVSVWGTNGRITADRQECRLYLREAHAGLPEVKAGWTVRYTTDLSAAEDFYLRGEEYSAQINYFVQAIRNASVSNVNSFRSALATDRLVAMIRADARGEARTSAATTPVTWWRRLFRRENPI
jgi:predicted dehydrogenase